MATSITETFIDQWFDQIQKVMSEPNLSVAVLLGKRLPGIALQLAAAIGPRENSDCQTAYDPQRSPELLLWALGLICETWTLEILRQKTRDGHCHTHKKQAGNPCPNGSKFHSEFLDEATESFRDVLTIINKRI